MEVAITTDFYQCSACLIEFESQEEYKKHYGTKFHQYNIKRKLINLEPATLEQFENRYNHFSKEKTTQREERIKSQKNYCETCGKGFGNQNTFTAHLQSKKHKETMAKKMNQSTQSKSSTVSKPSKVRSTLNDVSICLFCDKKLNDLETNMSHMEKAHGFFVVESKYCKDLKGLLKYLAEKINIGMLCIDCENKGCKDFKSGEAVKTHMLDKGHCFMNTKDFEEYAEYYDFSQNKEESIDEEQNQPESIEEQDIQQEGGDDSEEDWEDEESEEDVDIQEQVEEDDNNDGITQKQKLDKKEARKLMKKQYLKLNKIRMAKFDYNSLGELELDTGKTLGHRQYKQQYNMYYRNRADPLNNVKMLLGDQAIKSRQIMIKQKLGQYQLQQAYNRQIAHRTEEKFVARDRFRFARYKLKVGMNNNQTTMHHYRNQNPL